MYISKVSFSLITWQMELERSPENGLTYLKIPDLKVLSTKVFVRVWFISVAVFHVTLVCLFMVRIIPFWYSRFIESCTYLKFSWFKRLRLKSSENCYILFDAKISLKNFQMGLLDHLVVYTKRSIKCFLLYLIKFLQEWISLPYN